MKKLISILLSVLMLMSIAAPAAIAVTEEEYPTVYLAGFGGGIYEEKYNKSSKKIYPLNVDIGAAVSEALQPCLQQLAFGSLTGDYDKYCDELYNAFAPIYAELILDKNGEASDGSGQADDMTTCEVIRKTGGYDHLDDYDFYYDWRLSPITNAERLVDYIERVKDATGEKKVNIIGRCLGGNILAAYLTVYKEHAAKNVNTAVMYISSAMGVELIGALFAGEVKLNSEDVDYFCNYYMENGGLIEDETTADFISVFVSLLEQVKVLGVGTDMLNNIICNVKDNLIPRLVRDSYGSFPSFWAMCPPSYFERARDFSFKGVEKEYAGMIELIERYYNEVQLELYDTIEELEQNNGIKVSVIAKYNVPVIPVFENADYQGDLNASTKDISFGATTAKMGKVLSDEYIDSLKDTRFLAADHKIDASTCLIPERTWFFKNLTHAIFPDCVDELILEIIRTNGKLTVFDNPQFPQYLSYDKQTDSLTPVTELDEDGTKNEQTERISIFVRFIKHILNFIAKLFRGEIALPGTQTEPEQTVTQ